VRGELARLPTVSCDVLPLRARIRQSAKDAAKRDCTTGHPENVSKQIAIAIAGPRPVSSNTR
jgi:hypothetical protein